ncbi:45624_t:CDS:2, partial [Gigaspora margarita]
LYFQQNLDQDISRDIKVGAFKSIHSLYHEYSNESDVDVNGWINKLEELDDT